MARTLSDEEIQLRKRARRRLVGAIALVTIAVVVLPMALDQEPRPVTRDIAINIPAKDEAGSFEPKVAPPAAQPAPKPDAPKEAAAEPPKAEPLPPKAEKPAEAKPEPAARPKPAPEGEAFVVQLDAFSNAANAKQQQDKLAAAGIQAYTETVKTPKGDLTRVRVGPYASREAAEKARERLKKLGLNAVVVPK